MSVSDQLKLLIIFRKTSEDGNIYDPVFVKNHAELFFNNFRDNLQDENYEYDFKIVEARNIDLDSVYKADLYEIEVILSLYTPQSHSVLFSQIIQAWCEPKKNKLANLWLQIANPSVLQNTGKLHHSDVDIKEIAFGTLPDTHHFMQHYHYIANSGAKEISCSFLHSQKKLMIFACFGHSDGCKPVHNKFQFNYESISRVIVNYVPNSEFIQIFFHLRHTPFLYIKKTNKKKEEENVNISFLASDQEYQTETWERTLDFGCSCNRYDCTVEKIGRCPVFKVVIPKKHKTYDIIERLIQRCPRDTFFYFSNIKTLKQGFQKIRQFELFPFNEETFQLLSNKHKINEIKFKCQFAWEVLNSRSLEVRDQIALKYVLEPDRPHWENLKNKLKKYFKVDLKLSGNELFEVLCEITDALSKTFYDISEMISKMLIFTFEDALKKLFKHHLKSENDEEVPDGMCIVRRIVLTPSKILCLPPAEHFDNRVIRNFSKEHFLRVSIQDDNFQKLTYAVQYNSKREAILDRVVKQILLRGIFIGPRKYEILAASNSQLREHGLWMYAKDENGITAEDIRIWMGNFKDIKNVAKYMARMGQCFSTSDEAVQIELDENEFIHIDDIEVKENGQVKYTFTDGVGKISRDLAKEVQEAFAERHSPQNLDEEDVYDPSAFQIRFGGSKGMLAEARPEDLSGRKIAIRPSMFKFPCPSSSTLEIVKITAPRAVYLNRPLITILENLGVEPGVFLELQKKMVFNLTDSLIYDKKALKMFENCTSLPFPFMKLSRSGISLTQEPFFRSLLLCVYKSLIGSLKRKARIAISPKYGRNMMGVVDETKILNYGQIFAQYSEQVGSVKTPTKILKGTVVVTKNPCMHPGDVRKFEAVDVPALHHLKDCIVFPAKGKRPHPDEMAGSDLDGDEFVLIWDKRLIFPKVNQDPMDYPANEELSVKGDIKVEHMVDFICRYIQHDSIGLMANAYLAWADYNEEGIFSKVCMDIALKYPQALDFAKSGTTKYLERDEKPKFYPDFMEKGAQNNSYKSEKTLGLLYRVIRNLEASVSNMNSAVAIIPDSKFECVGWELFENLAKQRRDQYAKRVKNILKKYGIKSEAEALTGYLNDISDCNSNKYDSENISLLAKKYLFDTMKRYYLKFIQDCENERPKHPLMPKAEIRNIMASAWYMVTYQDNETGILSFPWAVSETLSEICSKKRERINSESMFINCYDTFLQSIWRNELNRVYGITTCFCMKVLKHCVCDWIQKSSFILAKSSQDVFCEGCFNRIIEKFISLKRMPCCSSYGRLCKCHQSCSPMKIVLEFFKFYATEVISDIGDCTTLLNNDKRCEGFRSLNLQSLALKTYATIAIAHGLPFRGLLSDTSNNDSGYFEEGNPIRVKVTKDFERILIGKVDDVCKILENLSGVKQVHIDGNNDRGAYYILVHSIGKAVNRWNLEELIMDPKCSTIIQTRL